MCIAIQLLGKISSSASELDFFSDTGSGSTLEICGSGLSSSSQTGIAPELLVFLSKTFSYGSAQCPTTRHCSNILVIAETRNLFFYQFFNEFGQPEPEPVTAPSGSSSAKCPVPAFQQPNCCCNNYGKA